jgi:aspartate 1-decarboxylase
MLKSRLHPVVVTAVEAASEDCLYLDRAYMKRADLWPFERVDALNASNGARFSILVLEAPEGSRQVRLAGAAAALARPGHVLTLTSYVTLSENELVTYRPRLINLLTPVE